MSFFANKNGTPLPKILAVVGPTGSGKSTLALLLAQRFGGHIINCDSVQVYCGFDIGSAKPTLAQRLLVPHDGLDLTTWDRPMNASDYSEQMMAVIGPLLEKNVPIVLCGGSGLYVQALWYGLLPAVPADLAMRVELTAREAAEPGFLYATLQKIDPQAAKTIHPHNRHHLLRAIDLTMQGEKPASLQKHHHAFDKKRLDMIVLVVDRPNAILKKRLEDRLQVMLALGWLQEVEQLLAQGVPPDAPPMKSVGYKEVVCYLQKKYTLQELHQAIYHSTWQYVRRQRTWWRRYGDTVYHLMLEGDGLSECCFWLQSLFDRSNSIGHM